ncbi:MAG: AsmA-like C-terminal region-containing protein [Chitinophagales bacterium]|nr:AsmA-like C-terminal region-containing protein [Chitinophagales bacterium]
MQKPRINIRLLKRTLLILLIAITAVLALGFAVAVSRENAILNTITREINSRIRGNVSIRDLDFTMLERFPAFSARLNDVSITDSMIAVHHDTLFRASSVSFQINVFSLITGDIHFYSIKLHNAKISVLTRSNGYCNASLSRRKKTPAAATPEIPVNRFIFENVAVQIRDSVKMKYYGWNMRDLKCNLETSDSLIKFKVNGLVHVIGLVFNAEKGGFFTEKDAELKLKAALNTASKTLTVAYSPVRLEKQPMMIKARFDLGRDPFMHLEFFSRSLLPAVAFPCLPRSSADKLALYKLSKPVTMYARIDGSLKAGSKPAVDAYFKSGNNTLTVAQRSYEQLSLLGWFTNHVDSTHINDDSNSKIVMPVFNGTIYSIPIQAQLTINNLITPDFFMTASMTYDKKRQGELNTERFRFTDGKIDIRFMFHGPLVNYVDTVNKKLLGRLHGEMLVHNASFDQVRSGYHFRNVNGHLRFNENDLRIDSIALAVNGNSARIAGNAKYFITFLFIPSINAIVNLDVKADTVNFNSFKKPVTTTEVKEAVRKRSAAQFIPSTIDWMTNHVELNLNINAAAVRYKRLLTTNVSGHVLIAPDFVRINDAFMNTSGGAFKLNAAINGLTKKKHEVELTANIRDASINELMYSFNNFGQDAMTSNNIFGIINADVSFSAKLNEKYDVVGPSMKGSITTSIKNGSLRNIATLQNISKYVFKNRDFSNIQFADMQNNFELNGTMMNLNEVQILSSVVTLFVEGQYDFNKNKTDLLFTIPFSNLKRMDASERMNMEAEAARKGGNFKLRVVNGDDGKLKLVPASTGNKKEKQQFH